MKTFVKRLNNWWHERSEFNLIKDFFSGVEHSESGRGRVLQYVGISSMYLSPTEMVLYHLLRKEGFDVDYCIYGLDVPINEVITRDRETLESKDAFWKRSYERGVRMLNAARIPHRKIKIFDRAKELAATCKNYREVLDFKYDEVNFGEIICGALSRYYKAITFGSDVDQVAQRMLVTALSNYMFMEDMCRENQYRYVMFSHGIYITWQPVVAYCERYGVDYICYDQAKTRNHGNFNVNQQSPDWSFDSAWERYRDRQLTKDEYAKVRKYLDERELQTGDVFSYNPTARNHNTEAEKKRLGIPLDRKTITIFTNLIWDAANFSRDIAFPNAFTCAVKTIEHFRSREDVQVIVRSHPAEKVVGTEERYAAIVRNHFGDKMPSNVTIVEPEDKVNSFTMIDMSDIGVVNTSTVGLEMALVGKPVLLISETHYRNKGFTYDMETEKEYFENLEKLLVDSRCLPNQVELAEKYFFMMMFLYQKQLPTIHSNRHCLTGFSKAHFSLLTEEDPIVKIVEQLTGDLPQDFLDWEAEPASTAV